ncbi:MPND isoform 8, partial [Pongo abelii]
DFHSHLTRSEVVGYLGGRWDINSQMLTVLRAFPCRSRLGDAETAAAIEEEMLLVEFYKGSPDLVRLQEPWSQEHTYLDKLKISLASRTPKDQSLCHVLEQVCGILKQGS